MWDPRDMPAPKRLFHEDIINNNGEIDSSELKMHVGSRKQQRQGFPNTVIEL